VPSSMAYGDEGRGLLIGEFCACACDRRLIPVTTLLISLLAGPGAALRFTLQLIKIK